MVKLSAFVISGEPHGLRLTTIQNHFQSEFFRKCAYAVCVCVMSCTEAGIACVTHY